MRNKRLLSIIGLLLIGSMLLAACGGAAEPAAPAAPAEVAATEAPAAVEEVATEAPAAVEEVATAEPAAAAIESNGSSSGLIRAASAARSAAASSARTMCHLGTAVNPGSAWVIPECKTSNAQLLAEGRARAA